MIDADAIRYRWETVGRTLDERGRRMFAAAEVRAAGWGGLAVVSEITGLARSTINRGEDDLDAAPLPPGQVRRAGGGRKAVSEKNPGLVPALQRLVEPVTLSDPERPLLWASKSMDKRAAALTVMDHPISADTVANELVKLGFSRQHNRKADEGSHHPRSQRAVRAHQCEGCRCAGCGAARHLRRHEEEGAGRQLQERRLRPSPQGQALPCQRARLRGQDAGQGCALRHL
jgi:hypothetical protein